MNWVLIVLSVSWKIGGGAEPIPFKSADGCHEAAKWINESSLKSRSPVKARCFKI